MPQLTKMEKRNQREKKNFSFEQVIRELDDVFISKSDRRLYKSILTAVEKPLIETVLDRTAGNQFKAAEILGINRNTLHSKIKKLGIVVTRWKR